MKFEVNQADFVEALGAMNRIAMRQVENTKVIRIEKVHDGRIRLIGTNLTMSLRYDISAYNVEGDAVNISLSLFPIVQKLNGVIEFDENKIRCGKSSFKIDKWAEQMPVNFEIKEAEEQELLTVDLFNAIVKTNYATQNINNSVLSGIYFNKAEVVGTDGNRLAKACLKENNSQFLMPNFMAEEVIKLFNSKQLKIAVGRSNIKVYNEEIELISQKLSGQYPNYSSILPKSFKNFVKINRKDLIKALELITVTNSQYACSFEINNNEIIIKNNIGQTEIDCESNTVDVEKIAFNPVFVLNALKTTGDEFVEFHYNSELAPCSFMSENLYALIMPVKLR